MDSPFQILPTQKISRASTRDFFTPSAQKIWRSIQKAKIIE
jgi:hypothetical protein